MKKFYIFIAILFAVFSFCSCKNQKKSHIAEVIEFRNTLTKEDTTQVLKLSNDCMELLKNKNIDQAVAMLYEYDDSLYQIQPLTESSIKSIKHTLKVFPVIRYKLSYYSLQSESINDVKYIITFSDEQESEQNGRPVTSFMFNPVKVDGVWYLCLKNPTQSVDDLRR